MIDLHSILEEQYPEISQVCRTIHENPELSMQEYDTCALLEEKVRANVSFERIKRVGETGLFVEVKGRKPGPDRVICLRGDMDALPIQEAQHHEPRSKKDGIMHACGHDVHASALLGAACALSKCRDMFSGTVYFFFQPAEETLQGAKLFLNDPDIDFTNVSGAVAVHVMHSLYAGKVGLKKGPMLAAADEIFVTVRGRSSHGATPENGVDAIVAQANIITALQTLVSRETSPLDNVVLTFGKIKGGTAHNIIASEVELHGTLRTITKEARANTDPLPQRIEGDRFYVPGGVDNTIHVVHTLMTARYITHAGIKPSGAGVLLVIDSGGRRFHAQTPQAAFNGAGWRYATQPIRIAHGGTREATWPQTRGRSSPSSSSLRSSGMKRASCLGFRTRVGRSFSRRYNSLASRHASWNPAMKLSVERFSAIWSCASMIRSTSLRSGFSSLSMSCRWHSFTDCFSSASGSGS